MQVESMIVLLRVQVAWERRVQVLNVEFDSLSVIKLLQNDCDMRHRCAQTIHNIRSFIDHGGCL